MGLTFMVVVGAVLGWLTAIVLQIESARGVLMNIIWGVSGALLAGLLVGPLLLGSTSPWAGDYRVGAVLLPLIGATVLVATLNLLRRWQPR